jgi:hypothetical protein
VSGAVTAGRLRLLLDSLHQIHTCKASTSQLPLSSSSGGSAAAAEGEEEEEESTNENGGNMPTSEELEQNYGPKVCSFLSLFLFICSYTCMYTLK